LEGNVADATRREIDGELSFALYGAANRMVRMHKPFLDPMGLTFPQYLVMVELLGGTPRTVGDLGSKLGMDTGTITPLLKRLEKAELVTRRRDAEDERRVLIDLTAAGDALRGRLRRVPDQIKSACRLTDDMAADLRDTLTGIARPATD
jgi:MarR family transcriptional regulator, organic hydroperoxide resistance regulator